MAKKSKKAKKTARSAKSTKTPRKAARSTKKRKVAGARGKKLKNELRFIMVIEPALKNKMRASAAKASRKAGKRVSMSAWARLAFLKAM